MARRERLVRAREKGDRGAAWFLTLRDWLDEDYETKPAGACSVSEICDVSDRAAESDNYHDSCGRLASLARIIRRHAGPATTVAIVREIVERHGGVHRL